MKKKCDVLFAIAFILCLVSVLMYALTGQGVWTATNGPGDVRCVILFLLHLGGIFVPLIYLLFRCEMEST